jgi:hypothetical protein
MRVIMREESLLKTKEIADDRVQMRAENSAPVKSSTGNQETIAKRQAAGAQYHASGKGHPAPDPETALRQGWLDRLSDLSEPYRSQLRPHTNLRHLS